MTGMLIDMSINQQMAKSGDTMGKNMPDMQRHRNKKWEKEQKYHHLIDWVKKATQATTTLPWLWKFGSAAIDMKI